MLVSCYSNKHLPKGILLILLLLSGLQAVCAQSDTEKETKNKSPYEVLAGRTMAFLHKGDAEVRVYLYNTGTRDEFATLYFKHLLLQSKKIKAVKNNAQTDILLIEVPEGFTETELENLTATTRNSVQLIMQLPDPYAEIERKIAAGSR